MSVLSIEASTTAPARVFTHRRLRARGTACLVSPMIPRPSTSRWLKVAALGFDAVWVGGVAALVWSLVAGLQPVLVMTHVY